MAGYYDYVVQGGLVIGIAYLAMKLFSPTQSNVPVATKKKKSN